MKTYITFVIKRSGTSNYDFGCLYKNKYINSREEIQNVENDIAREYNVSPNNVVITFMQKLDAEV